VRAVAVIALLALGCGFHAVGPPDLGPAVDALSPELIGVDGGNVVDDGGGSDAGGLTGPGPLGALPNGYCCTGNGDCRSRECGANQGCLDRCFMVNECALYLPGSVCNVQTGFCSPPSMSTCLDSSTYQRGALPTGACCSGGAGSGDECAGGFCIGLGFSNFPYYCSQGCTTNEPCPAGFACETTANGAPMDLFQCLKIEVFYSANAHPYTCQ
jgi:hypothetical protein